MSKLIYAASLAAFLKAYPEWSSPTNKAYSAVAYTGDGYIITNGTILLTGIGSGDNPYGLDYTLTGQKATVSVAGVSKSITLPVIGAANGTALSQTITNGIITYNHSDYITAGTIGPTENSSSTISVPKLTYNAQGHLTAATSFTATLDTVKRTASSGAGVLLFADNSNGTSAVNYNSNISVNNGTLLATAFNENGTLLVNKYADIAHKTVSATNTVLGHVKLSDEINNSSSTNAGIAATPKAVKDALDAAKALFASNDAMLFVGTLSGTGVIMTSNPAVITGVTNGTTKISELKNYSAGWTFRVTGNGGTITGIGNVESGDMVVCISDYKTAYSADDWSVIQANLDGAVTAGSALTINQLVVGDGNRGLTTLTKGVDGQVLKMVGGIPAWGSDNNSDTWRTIQVNSANFLTGGTNTGVLDLVNGTGVALTTAGNKVTISTNLNALSVFSQGGATAIGEYNPQSSTSSIDFTGGLSVSLTGNKFTVQHSNSAPVTGTGGKLYALEIDTYGHISKTREVTSLANPFSLSFGVGSSLSTYDGSSAASFKIATEAGTDCSIAAVHSGGTITLTPSITHKYRPIAFKANSLTLTATTVLANTSSGTLTLSGGSNVSIANNSGELTISATNSWRNVTAYKLSNNTAGEVLPSTVGTADLEFSSDFLWDDSVASDGRLHIGWAIVAEDGTITYRV